MDYCFRETAPKTYEVTGFEDGKKPEKSYEITGRKCSCPAHVPYCRHLKMLDHLLQSGGVEGAFIDSDSLKVHRLPGLLTSELKKGKSIESLL